MRIELKGISKRFSDERQVLNNLTYCDDVHTMAIIGPSGGGKSTLLRIIGGLIYPTFGEVFIDGKRIEYNEKALIHYRRSIGFVFQSKGLFSHLTGLENITMPLIHVHGHTKKSAKDIAIGLLDRFGLKEDGYKYPNELSGGQQQRIAIAKAIAIKPKLLLLDEPTSALDPELTSEVLDMINELKNDSLNIILVTHEMGFAKNACEKLMFLSHGEIVEYGKSRDVFSNPKTQKLENFLGKVLEWIV